MVKVEDQRLVVKASADRAVIAVGYDTKTRIADFLTQDAEDKDVFEIDAAVVGPEMGVVESLDVVIGQHDHTTLTEGRVETVRVQAVGHVILRFWIPARQKLLLPSEK